MKNLLLFALLLIFPFFSISQIMENKQQTIPELKVPLPVIESQRNIFPENAIQEWKIQKILDDADPETVGYISKFKKDGRSGFSAFYLSTGQLIFHSQFIPEVSIPQNIRLLLQENYKEYNILSGDFITLFGPERQLYRIRLHDNAQKVHAYYDSWGNEIHRNTLPLEVILFDEY